LLFAMGRRDFLGTPSGAGWTFLRINLLTLAADLSILLASSAAMAQETAKIHRIGYLSADSNLPHEVAFIEGLRSLGYLEGQNITILRRSAQTVPTSRRLGARKSRRHRLCRRRRTSSNKCDSNYPNCGSSGGGFRRPRMGQKPAPARRQHNRSIHTGRRPD